MLLVYLLTSVSLFVYVSNGTMIRHILNDVATYLLLKNYTLYYTHQNWLNTNNVGLQHIKNMSFSKFKVPRFRYLFLLFLGIQIGPRNMFMEREREIVTKTRGIYIIASIYTRPSRNLSRKKYPSFKIEHWKILRP